MNIYQNGGLGVDLIAC